MMTTELPLQSGSCYVWLLSGPDENRIKQAEDELLTHRHGHTVELEFVVEIEHDGEVSDELTCTLGVSEVLTFDDSNGAAIGVRQDGRFATGLYDYSQQEGYVYFAQV